MAPVHAALDKKERRVIINVFGFRFVTIKLKPYPAQDEKGHHLGGDIIRRCLGTPPRFPVLQIQKSETQSKK